MNPETAEALKNQEVNNNTEGGIVLKGKSAYQKLVEQLEREKQVFFLVTVLHCCLVVVFDRALYRLCHPSVCEVGGKMDTFG